MQHKNRNFGKKYNRKDKSILSIVKSKKENLGYFMCNYKTNCVKSATDS